MLDNRTKANMFPFLILILLLRFSLLNKPREIQNESERIKKGLFLDSYMLSQNALFYNKTFYKENEKEKNKDRNLAENEITLRDVGFFPYQIGSHTRSFWSYMNIFDNIGKDRSKYILYPYAFRYKKKKENGKWKKKNKTKEDFLH